MRIKKLDPAGFFHHLVAGVIVLSVAIVGVGAMVASHANKAVSTSDIPQIITVTNANNGQTINVPLGDVVKIDLTNTYWPPNSAPKGTTVASYNWWGNFSPVSNSGTWNLGPYYIGTFNYQSGQYADASTANINGHSVFEALAGRVGSSTSITASTTHNAVCSAGYICPQYIANDNFVVHFNVTSSSKTVKATSFDTNSINSMNISSITKSNAPQTKTSTPQVVSNSADPSPTPQNTVTISLANNNQTVNVPVGDFVQLNLTNNYWYPGTGFDTPMWSYRWWFNLSNDNTGVLNPYLLGMFAKQTGTLVNYPQNTQYTYVSGNTSKIYKALKAGTAVITANEYKDEVCSAKVACPQLAGAEYFKATVNVK